MAGLRAGDHAFVLLIYYLPTESGCPPCQPPHQVCVLLCVVSKSLGLEKNLFIDENGERDQDFQAKSVPLSQRHRPGDLKDSHFQQGL